LRHGAFGILGVAASSEVLLRDGLDFRRAATNAVREPEMQISGLERRVRREMSAPRERDFKSHKRVTEVTRGSETVSTSRYGPGGWPGPLFLVLSSLIIEIRVFFA